MTKEKRMKKERRNRRIKNKKPNQKTMKMTIINPDFNESDIKSPMYEDLKVRCIEDFRGYIDDLRKCEFWSSVQFDRPSRLKELMDFCKKHPMKEYISSVGGLTGIGHICYWNNELKTFMTWSHTPKDLI